MRTAAVLLAAGAAGRAEACALALALAVDVSGSVDAPEYRLQLDGLAVALSDPTVAEALIAEQAAVTVIQWAGAAQQQVAVPWVRMTDAGALARLGRAVAAVRRPWLRSSTGLGAALLATAERFRAVADCRRRVIDVSGDGRSNEGPPPRTVRAALARRGVTVNGLAITGSEPFLAEYYRDHVIAGLGAFVMTASGYSDYPKAIRRKLIAEVVVPVTGLPGGETLRAEAGR